MALPNNTAELLLKIQRRQRLERIGAVLIIVCIVGACIISFYHLFSKSRELPQDAPIALLTDATSVETLSNALRNPEEESDDEKEEAPEFVRPSQAEIDAELKRILDRDPNAKLLPGGTSQSEFATLGDYRYDAETVLKKFFEANTALEKSAFVRNSEKTLPYMEEYYSRPAAVRLDGPGVDLPNFDRVGEVNLVREELRLLIYVEALFEGGVRKNVVMERVKDEWFLDWESYVIYSPLAWDGFIKTPTTYAVPFRVLVSNADFYFPPYTESRLHHCVKIVHPLHPDQPIYGYFSKEDRHFANLIPVLQARSKGQVPMILLLQKTPEPSRDNMFDIKSSRGIGWLDL